MEGVLYIRYMSLKDSLRNMGEKVKDRFAVLNVKCSSAKRLQSGDFFTFKRMRSFAFVGD